MPLDEKNIVRLADHGRWDLRDIPQGLRKLAAVVTLRDDDAERIQVNAFGDVVDDLCIAGILAAGVTFLTE